MAAVIQQAAGGTGLESHAQKADREPVCARDVLVLDRQTLSEIGACVISGVTKERRSGRSTSPGSQPVTS